ncbi:hypothetical protein IBX73_02810 [candidate division WOR-3 bacterium]|nr:hypothetical protein [candidate division WOR-3 bacterium]
MKALHTVILMVLALNTSAGEPGMISQFFGRLKIGQPSSYKNLLIFPLMAQPAKNIDLVTLDEAMDRNWLKIREIGSGEINHVELKNSGPSMIFMMTGEMLSGAKQDRMLGQDLLVPAKSGWLRVPVFCVEHGRWVSSSATFKSSREVAPSELRQRARITEDQSEVWDAIASSQQKLGIASGTSTVHANYEDEGVKKELASYTGHFGRLPRLNPNTVGVVVATGDRILCVDIFADNGLLMKVWSKLLRSYAMDAITQTKAAVNRSDIKELMQALSKATHVSLSTPGAGDLYRIETPFGRGSALLHNSRLVHLDFFVDDLSDNDGPQWRLDRRRDERLNE